MCLRVSFFSRLHSIKTINDAKTYLVERKERLDIGFEIVAVMEAITKHYKSDIEEFLNEHRVPTVPKNSKIYPELNTADMVSFISLERLKTGEISNFSSTISDGTIYKVSELNKFFKKILKDVVPAEVRRPIYW